MGDTEICKLLKTIEEKKKILNELIESGASKDDIYKASMLTDKFILRYQKLVIRV